MKTEYVIWEKLPPYNKWVYVRKNYGDQSWGKAKHKKGVMDWLFGENGHWVTESGYRLFMDSHDTWREIDKN